MKDRNTREYIMREAFDQAELRRRESMCVHGEPAFCVAGCPIHLDAKKLCAAVEAGDFAAGRRLIEQVTPFVNVLSAYCGAPCTQGCKRSECGGSVNVNALERACAEYATPVSKRILPTKSKGKMVAVAGDDLFCIQLAYELSVKAYDVTLYCTFPSLSDALSSSFPDMTADKLEADLKPVLDRRFNIKYNWEGGGIPAADYICCSSDILTKMGVNDTPDPITLLTSGGIISCPPGSVVDIIRYAKSAAITIDRLAQNLAPDLNRDKEGPYETSLFTSTESVNNDAPVTPTGEIYTKDEAILEASRCLGCECTECIKSCVYMQDYKRNPKQMIREYYNNLSIVMGNHMANTMINSCTLCGLCKQVCPNGFDLPDACIIARQTMVSTNKMPPSAHEFALLDLDFSMGEEFFTVLRANDQANARYVFFPGCQAAAIIPQTILKTYKYLCSSFENSVDIILGCCGIPAYWAGRAELFDEAILKLRSAWEGLGCPTIITACPNCLSVFRENLTENVVGVWDESIMDSAQSAKGSPSVRPLRVHDSCGARYDEKTKADVRKLAKKLGNELIEADYSKSGSACCGYGGLVSYVNRDLASRMAKFAGEGEQLVYCASCRDRFMKEGGEPVHILELLFGREETGSPDLSQKRKNRKLLKREILKLGEGDLPLEKEYDFSLELCDEVKAMMEDRMVLESDLMSVIENARETGAVILDKQTGEFVTNQRLGKVTFWVRYTVDGSIYKINSVYSHRMTVAAI